MSVYRLSWFNLSVIRFDNIRLALRLLFVLVSHLLVVRLVRFVDIRF